MPSQGFRSAPANSSAGQRVEEKDRQPARNIVPVKRPDVLRRDRIGKHRAVAVELQLVL